MLYKESCPLQFSLSNIRRAVESPQFDPFGPPKKDQTEEFQSELLLENRFGAIAEAVFLGVKASRIRDTLPKLYISPYGFSPETIAVTPKTI